MTIYGLYIFGWIALFGSKQKCIVYLEKNDHLWSFLLYNQYIFVWIQHGCLANMGFALDPSNSVIKRLLCIKSNN